MTDYEQGYADAEKDIRIAGFELAANDDFDHPDLADLTPEYVIGYRTCIGVHRERLAR
jgi:hypothetical protein